MSFSTDNHGKINSQTLKIDKRKLDEDDDDEFLFVKWLTDKNLTPFQFPVDFVTFTEEILNEKL